MKRSISVEDIRCFAYHGCMEEEAKIGTWFNTTVSLDFDYSKSAKSDDLQDTLDYCLVAEIVQEEMAVRSKLVETVLERIFKRLEAVSGVSALKVSVTKERPPIVGEVGSVTLSMEQ